MRTLHYLTVKSRRSQRIPSYPSQTPGLSRSSLSHSYHGGSEAVPLGLGPKALRTKVRDLQVTCGSFTQECTAQATTRDCRDRGHIRGTQTNSVGGYPERKMNRCDTGGWLSCGGSGPRENRRGGQRGAEAPGGHLRAASRSAASRAGRSGC